MEKKEKMALTVENYRLLLIAVAIILIGLLLMSGGAATDPSQFNESEIFSFRRITLAPIVIISGFAFGIYAIMKRPKDKKA
ncbi:MAG: DUF3098 domain-containing protein [Rikenellaceae bacterium]